MKLKLFAAFLFLTGFVFGQAGNSNNQPPFLIPAPQKITLDEGSFKLPASVGIVLGNPKSKEDSFAANQLIELLKTEIHVRKTSIAKSGNIIISLPGAGKEIDEILKKNEMLQFPNEIGEQGYCLKVTSKEIIITANNSTGLFYGVQTLKQLLRNYIQSNSIPCLTITDWPALKLRGWMDDISRGPIPTMDFLKKTIRTMAEYKQNYFTLYTEHTFKLKKYPDISPYDGITAEEIAELTEYAKDYHIEIIGNAQSFGHMSKILNIPFYDGLKENSDVLNPSIEDTYKFLDEMYSEIAPAYKSKLFNINCDETYGLGTGGAKKMVDSIGQDGVYAYHINRINNILKKYDKRIMMWGDIAVDNKNIIDKLPKDLIILSWGYHPADSFDDAIMPFKKSGFEFMVAPGVSCWSEVWPNMTNAAINISNYVRDGYKFGAMGMMNTAWDDDGENLFNYNWHGLIWGAECSWKPASAKTGTEAVTERNRKLNSFNNAFDKLFFGCRAKSAVNTLLKFDEFRKLPVKDIVRDGAFWSSMLDIFPDNVSKETAEANNALAGDAIKLIDELNSLKEDVTLNKDLIDHAIFAAKRVLFTAEKNLMRVSVADRLKPEAKPSIKGLKISLKNLNEELFSLKREYIGLWNRENRGWWLDKVLDKYNKLGEQILNLDKNVFIKQKTGSNGLPLIELTTLYGDKDICYTINGVEPGTRSDKYTSPIELKNSSLLRARVIEEGNKYPAVEKYFLVHKAIGKLFKLNSEYSKYNPAYSGGGANALVDGLTGSDNFADGRWQGFQGQNVEVILDLGAKTEISKVGITCLQNSYSWILMPAGVKVYSSEDGINFNLIKEIQNPVDPKLEGAVIHNFSAGFSNTSVRYLKIVCVYPGDLPKWHHAAGNQSFIFADEIVVE